MNSDNSKTSDPRRILLNLADKTIIKKSDKQVGLSDLSIYYAWENIKKSYKSTKFKIPAVTWNEDFVLPDGSQSILDIQDYFKYILKKHGTVTDNPSVMIQVNKIRNRFTFKQCLKQ